MDNVNVMGKLHDVLTDMGTLNRHVFGAIGDDKINSEFHFIHESLLRCRELIRAAAVVHSHDRNVELRAAAPALKTIAIHHVHRDTLALLRHEPTDSGDDYVLVTIPELRSLLDDEQGPEFAVPSHFVRKALRAANASVTSHEAMKQALASFLHYCGASDLRALVTALINATTAYRLANSVCLVLPLAVRREPATERLASLVRAAFPTAARLYGNHQSSAVTDANGTVIALPDSTEDKNKVADFAKRHGVAFAPLWALHRELRRSDELHDVIWEIA